MIKALVKPPQRPAPATATQPGSKPRVGLALGGGGARGLAHILMLEAFEELDLEPVAIAGTSIGAVYGAARASGLSSALIRAHTEETLSQRIDLARLLLSARAEPAHRLFKLLPLRSALLDPEALLDLLLPSRVPSDFASLRIPLALVATDFYAQEARVLSKGPLQAAIAASIALPALFQPVMIEGRALVDGGLVNPLPFDLLSGACDVTVAIDVSGASRTPEATHRPGGLETLFASSQILQRSIVREKLKHTQPDIYVDVAVDQFHVLEFHRFREILVAAAPAKAALKRQLERILASITVREVLPAPSAEDPAAPVRAEGKLASRLGLKRRRPKK